ncbi:hypothetical protein F5Y11DRAFT_28811 [Daldinia sp. FL1419]|nr:hypothetical protein F5Y11DRAFT_28811 [Daldinia sp. FL1419]
MTKPWEVYEAIIKDLYADNTLSVVQKIMIERYGFRASVRAYRGRLIRWGIRKYNCRKRASPSVSNSSADGGASFSSGSDAASPIMAAASAVGDARAILPRKVMKQGHADGHLALPGRLNQQYSSNHRHQIFNGADNSFDSKPKTYLSTPQHSSSGNSNDGIQYGWETPAPLFKKESDAVNLDELTSSRHGEALAAPTYFGGIAPMMQPGNGSKSSYGTGYAGTQHHHHHRSTEGGAGDGLNYYNPAPPQQQPQARGSVVGVSQVPPDVAFAAQARGYGHDGRASG